MQTQWFNYCCVKYQFRLVVGSNEKENSKCKR